MTEPQTSVRRSNRLQFAKQTEKLGGVPYQTNNNRKKQTVNCITGKDGNNNKGD